MRKAMSRMWARHRANLILLLLLMLFVVAFLLPRIFIVVHAGERGVYFRLLFGGVITTRVYGEGLRLAFPWDTLTIYDVKMQESQWKYEVLSSDGLAMTLQVSARYHPNINSLPLLHQHIGPRYKQKVVLPIIEASLRRAVGKHKAEELYGDAGAVLDEINQESASALGEFFIGLDGVSVRSITLPQSIRLAVEAKEQQHQLLEAYTYRLRREKDEAVRKEIEAFGVMNYNTIVGASLTPRLLQWRGIEATRELATSPNAKIVIMGNGDKGLPVILNAEAGTGPPAAVRVKSDQEILSEAHSMNTLEDKLSTTRHLFDSLLKKNAPPPAPSPSLPLPSPGATP